MRTANRPTAKYAVPPALKMRGAIKSLDSSVKPQNDMVCGL